MSRRSPFVLSTLLALSACDLSALLYSSTDGCETFPVDCPTGCVEVAIDDTTQVSAEQCGEVDGTSSCWAARTDVGLGGLVCAYADEYDSPGSSSTCSSLTIKVCSAQKPASSDSAVPKLASL